MKRLVLILGICLFPLLSMAQDDLMDLLEEQTEETTNYTIATFKATRLINGHTIEAPSKGVLQFLISHRFGRINGGAYEFFGLDQANIRLGLDYGITDWLSIGIGRSNVLKTYDGFVKAKILRQSTGKKKMPISISGFAGMAINTLRWEDTTRENYFSSRIDYSFQLLIARKFGEKLSLQLMPSLVHRNLVEDPNEANDVFALGAGGRFKLSPSISLNVEYYYVFPNQITKSRIDGQPVTNSLSIGIDIETGGHVFQLMAANSRYMTENLFIPETTGQWSAGDIHLGFAISRVFTIVKDKDSPKKDW